jgi:hypothetical protein
VEDLPKDGLLYRKIYFNRLRPDGEPEGRLDSGADLYFFYNDVYGYTNRSNDNPVDIAQRYQGAVMVLGKWGSEPEMAWAMHEAQTLKWNNGDQSHAD